jgi:hypothetical protein
VAAPAYPSPPGTHPSGAAAAVDGWAYRRLLDARRAVEVRLPDRRGPDVLGLDGDVFDARAGRWWPMAWYRGGSLLTLLAVPRPSRPTGSLGRRLRERRLRG